MTIIDFVHAYVPSFTPVMVVSGYNGKVLMKNYKPEKRPDIDARSLYGVHTIIRTSAEQTVAIPVLVLTADGNTEWQAEREGIALAQSHKEKDEEEELALCP